MKTYFLKTLAIGLLVSALSARAGYLITIDESNPYAVVFTGTGNNPTNTDIGVSYNDGVTLVNFFTASTGGAGAINYDPAPSLAPASVNSVTYLVWQSDRYLQGSTSYVNMNLLYPGPSSPQFFITSAPAFTGTSYIDLSAYGLPAYGAHGPIYAGNDWNHGSGVPIGEWIVIGPVPPPPPAPPLPDMAFGSLARISPTQFGFSIGGSNGVNYTVQYSTNLASTNWATLTSFQLTTNPFPIVDENATNSVRYYRVLKN